MTRNLLFCVLVLSATTTQSRAQERAFSVQDDIKMIRFNDPSATDKPARANFSPDGTYYVVVTSRGMIGPDETESTISVFGTEDTRRFINEPDIAPPLRPRIHLDLRGRVNSLRPSPYDAVVTDLRWASDSSSLYFLAENSSGHRRLYRLVIKTGNATPLTPDDQSVLRFDFSNTSIAYSAVRFDRNSAGVAKSSSDSINMDARAVSGESIDNILFPQSSLADTSRTLWTLHLGNTGPVPSPVRTAPDEDVSWLPEAFSISPSGHYLIHLIPVQKIPSDWELYEPAVGAQFFRVHRDDRTLVAVDNLWRLKEYELTNLMTGGTTSLVDAPQSFTFAYTRDSKALWAPDERRVLLTNTYLPLNDGARDLEQRKNAPCAVVAVNLPGRDASCIVYVIDRKPGSTGGVISSSLRFGPDADVVLLDVRQPTGAATTNTYTFSEGRWKLFSSKPINDLPEVHSAKGQPKSTDLKVEVRQTLNEPPTLWGTLASTGKSKELWDPNPQLASLRMGRASSYHWRDKTGHEWAGGLVRPVDYVPGKQYPLVIQIYNFYPDQFLSDGMMPTAMAARALASSGIAVLQVQRRMPHTFDSAEADAQLEGMLSGIDQLSREGLVDPKHVGIVGFSFSCWYVENALIKAPDRFEAATIADGLDISYMQYHLVGMSSPSLREEFEKVIGTKPVGDGLRQWLASAPGFHLDKIASPLRLEAIGPLSVLLEWEIYSTLEQAGKAVDMIYFPQGQHIHQRPQERLESQQGDVDWFRFWLQEYEDPDPTKIEQYKRWRLMKTHVASVRSSF